METPTTPTDNEDNSMPTATQPATPIDMNERLQRGKVPEAVVEAIVDALRGLKYGQVTITVQDGHVVQIERLDRRRLKS